MQSFNRKFPRVLLGAVLTAMTLPAVADDTDLGTLTVTGTREAQALAETPSATSALDTRIIDETRPGHPSELMGRVPGVHVNVTGGEGHMTALRHPITTDPVYLYLEDGVPTRSAGFFNHNALYEINLPHADRVEVIRGPGTALYGSDAIGGVINVLTRPTPAGPALEISPEIGEHGWGRLLVTGGNGDAAGGWRVSANVTRSDGWRDGTDYDRQSLYLRHDRFLDSGATLRTTIAASNIDQATAGSSAISEADYRASPTVNYTPISYRKVQALRVATNWEQVRGDTLVSVMPFVRYNSMEMLPNWSLTFDPQLYTTENHSVGLMAKVRRDFTPMRTRVLAGIDIDHSPGSYEENVIDPFREGNIFTSWTIGERIYDYDVTFTSLSPYLHAETSPIERLRVSAGLRYDHMEYDYDSALDPLDSGDHRRPESGRVDFSHLGPRLGATWAFSDRLNGFAAYRNTFRVPSQNQIFRQGQAEDTLGLEPVTVDAFDIGLRGHAARDTRYEVTLYYMVKDDDILSFTNTVDGTTEVQNAGETLHRGIEVGVGTALTDTLRVDLAWSYAKHTFEDWQPRTGVDFSGNEMSAAPRRIGDVRLGWRPVALNGGHFELNWEYLGSYWMDNDNTERYDGHDLWHLRAMYPVNRQWMLHARVMNLTDERHASTASYTQFRGREFAPGLPRTVYGGFTWHWS